MKKKNGFTLIELLAVIVILAIIALIAVPQILNILNKARLNAAKDSTYGIVKAAETYATNFMLENNGTMPSEAIEFECSGNGCNLKTTLTGYNLTGLNNLDFKGTKPTSGKVTISNNGRTIVATNLKINGFNCNYANGEAKCEVENGSTTPVVTGPTSETPTGVGYTGVLKIVYLDPTDLTKNCNSSNINSDTGTNSGCMKWYAYADDGTNYTMILDHNTTIAVAWDSNGNNGRGPVTVNARLDDDTIGWNGNPRLITVNEIAQITGNKSWTTSSIEFYFDTLTTNSTNEGNFGWLFDRTSSDCTAYGCLNNATETNYVRGYWTSDHRTTSLYYAWYVQYNGSLMYDGVANGSAGGVRPVITVPKSKIN